jgi:hypothetical protein
VCELLTSNLTHLEFCYDMGEHALSSIAYQCPNLETLELTLPHGSAKMTDTVVCQRMLIVLCAAI